MRRVANESNSSRLIGGEPSARNPLEREGPDRRGDEIAGYRIVRTLGVGTRSVVYLGHGRGADPSESVAVKLFSSEVTEESVAQETDALAAVSSLHIVRLLDVTSDGQTRGVILERLEAGSLASVLRTRGRIRAGEAVTVLTSVLRGVRDLHAVGLAHNALDLNSVHFDSAGRPVLTSLGYSTSISHSRRNLTEDWEQFAVLAESVCESVDVDVRRNEVDELFSCINELAAGNDQLAQECEDRLFSLSPPSPVVLVPPTTSPAQLSNGIANSRRPNSEHNSYSDKRAFAGHNTRNFGLGIAPVRTRKPDGEHGALVSTVEKFLESAPIHKLALMVTSVFHKRRKPVLVAVIVVIGLVTIGLTVIPSQTSEGLSAPHESKGTTPSAPAATPTSLASGEFHPVVADGPVEAAEELLSLRAACLSQKSIQCLSELEGANSAIFNRDRDRIGAAGQKKAQQSDSDYSSYTASLVERTGAAALVELTPSKSSEKKPASLLIIKSETGWHLREMFAD